MTVLAVAMAAVGCMPTPIVPGGDPGSGAPSTETTATIVVAPPTTSGVEPTTAPTTTAPSTSTTAESTTSTTAVPTTSTTAAPTTMPPMTMPPMPPSEQANLKLILSNPSRNTAFDDNPFADVPAEDIKVSDLTRPGDQYPNVARIATNGVSGYFRAVCDVSHFAYDDPIVFPGQPGKAHLHMFFGNTKANAYSTYESLLNTGTGTCNGEDLNRTSYWVPAMLDPDGNALIPYHVMVYYKNDLFRLNGANAVVSPFPDNLRMITGQAGARTPQTATSNDDSLVVKFGCGGHYNVPRYQSTIPTCRSGQFLEMQLRFAQCWNPEAGTYRSDQSHWTFNQYGWYSAECPASHPVDLPSIMYRIWFDPSDGTGNMADYHLSSDVLHDGTILPGGTTLHGDWFGAWHPEAMDLWIENCTNRIVDCKNGMLQVAPDLSMVMRSGDDFYRRRGNQVSAADLVKLCPGKELVADDALRSVANCHHAHHGH
ncbi:MAG: DUF1996 domain-containing protein [Actinomycetota bacterium]